MWAGVDVGGRSKGFHVAVVDEWSLVAGPVRRRTPSEAVHWVGEHFARVVAVDSPRSLAGDGSRSRECERALVRAQVCGLRFTPDRAILRGRRDAYYEWIEHGLELYAALESAGLETIECFPTAAWTRLFRPRDGDRRSDWSRDALEKLGLRDVRDRLSQDDRDAIAAAVTARLYEAGETESFGEIVVPRARR